MGSASKNKMKRYKVDSEGKYGRRKFRVMALFNGPLITSAIFLSPIAYMITLGLVEQYKIEMFSKLIE